MTTGAPPQVHQLANATRGWLSPAEGNLLYTLAKGCETGCIVEIGAFEGKSTTYLATGSRAGAGVPVYSIDPHSEEQGGSNTFAAFQKQIKRIGLASIVHPIVATSAQAAASFSEAIGVLFIDGAHDEISVVLDWEQWVPRVVPGGFVAMHDTLIWRAPRELAEARLLRSAEFRSTGIADSITFGQKRRPEDPEPDRLDQYRVLALKQVCNWAARVGLPEAVKKPGSRILHWLQR